MTATLPPQIQMLIDQDLGQLVEDRSQWARNRERFGQGGPAPGTGANAAVVAAGGDNGFQARGERRKWPEVKLPIELETIRNFNVRAKVVGPGGLFVKHIQSETGTRVQIKGLGSGFYDQETGRESDEPMHISITSVPAFSLRSRLSHELELPLILSFVFSSAADRTRPWWTRPSSSVRTSSSSFDQSTARPPPRRTPATARATGTPRGVRKVGWVWEAGTAAVGTEECSSSSRVTMCVFRWLHAHPLTFDES